MIESALDPGHFQALVARHLRERRAVQELHGLLLRMGDMVSHTERSAWIEELGNWLHQRGASFGGSSDAERTRRLRALVLSLSSVRGFKENFAILFTGVVRELRGTKLFADVGIPVEPAFLREAFDRIARRLIPVPPSPRSFADFIPRLFATQAEARWLEASPPELWMKVWTLLETTSAPLSTAWMPLAGSMADAMRILAARIAALGVAQDVRDRLPAVPVRDLPFLQLSRMCDAVQLGPPRMSTSNEAALQAIAECRDVLEQVHAHVEEYGVSVDLVYRLELIAAQLTRLEQLVVLLVPQSVESLPRDLGRFALGIVRAQFQGQSVLELLRASSHVLARKIVERSGKTGEHYITRTRGEWRAMLVSAAGGGFLTGFTTAFKFLLGSLGLGVLASAMAASANYAVSFLVMGAVGFTLATKQPSMTAAALATSLESRGFDGGTTQTRLTSPTIARDDSEAIERLVGLFTQISRSQLAAAIGNVFMVIPTALVFDLVWQRTSGHPMLGPEKAQHVVESLSPIHGGTVVYAALTGVLLWISSLGAGWLENWVTYRRIPEALASHRRLKRLFGARRAKAFAIAVGNGAASFGGSVTLGVLLGLVPALGLELGVPLDVRHVTLSTGSLVFAVSALGQESLGRTETLEATLGIACIGALNFGVSFVLALAVALRARDGWRVGSVALLGRLARALLQRFLHHPLAFFFPPRS